MRIYLNRLASSLWIKPHQFKNIHLTTCAFVWSGRLAYVAICDKSDCFGSTLLFFFVEPIHRWSTYRIQFFLFWKNFILIWNKSVFLKKFIFKLFFNKFLLGVHCRHFIMRLFWVLFSIFIGQVLVISIIPMPVIKPVSLPKYLSPQPHQPPLSAQKCTDFQLHFGFVFSFILDPRIFDSFGSSLDP